MKETINHPEHYGGSEDPYEAIKVIEAWGLNFNLGNTVKYINRRGKKQSTVMNQVEDLKKARWYLDREIQNLEKILPTQVPPRVVGSKEFIGKIIGRDVLDQ